MNYQEKTEDELVNDLDEDNAWEAYAELERREKVKRDALFARLKVLAGKKFMRALEEYLAANQKEAGIHSFELEYRTKPLPKRWKQRQEEIRNARVRYVWVNQWSVGYDGDSFSGYIFLHVKGKLYLKMGFSC